MLSGYLDGAEYEIDCMSLEGELCDNYIADQNVSICQKRKLEFELEKEEK